jgi:hypothetical protein
MVQEKRKPYSEMDGSEAAALLLEGVCPNCGGHVELVRVCGQRSFVSEWTGPDRVLPIERSVTVRVWDVESNYYARGGLAYKCAENCGVISFYIEQTIHGDWV